MWNFIPPAWQSPNMNLLSLQDFIGFQLNLFLLNINNREHHDLKYSLWEPFLTTSNNNIRKHTSSTSLKNRVDVGAKKNIYMIQYKHIDLSTMIFMRQ